jgi:hypothetical protein
MKPLTPRQMLDAFDEGLEAASRAVKRVSPRSDELVKTRRVQFTKRRSKKGALKSALSKAD